MQSVERQEALARVVLSDAPRCPGRRGIADLQDRISRLEAYEKWRQPRQFNLKAIVGEKLWTQHWKNWQDTLLQMKKSQIHAEILRERIIKHET